MTFPEREPSSREVRDALDVIMGEALLPATGGLAALYAFFAVTHALVLEASVARVMAPVAAASAIALLAIHVAGRRGAVPPRRAHAVGALVAALALVNSWLLLVLLQDPKQTTNFVLLLIGVGFFFLSVPWFTFVVAIVIASWAGAAYALPPSPDWMHYTFALLSGLVLAALAHTVRYRVFRRVETLRIQEARHREALERAAIAARAGEAALREREARLRHLSDAAFEALVIHDGERILDVNRAFTEMFGPAREAVIGRAPVDFVAPEERDAVTARMKGKDDPVIETTLLREDGTRFPAELHARRTPYEGRMVRVAAVRDLTERKRAEEERRLAHARLLEIDRLSEVNRFKTQLLNMTSHELNTPLTPLRLQLHLLASGKLGPLTQRQAGAIEVLDRNVERLSLLVHDVLEVARLESTRLRLARERVDLSRLTREAIDAYAEVARAAGLTLESEVAAPLEADADPQRVTQILYNLLSNAIKFTPHGGRVRVIARAAGEAVELRVEDTGMGLDAEQIARLFQPFSRVHDSAPRENRGTGLGLYISRGLVEQHGGRLSVESPGRGKGSTFAFTIPVRAEAA